MKNIFQIIWHMLNFSTDDWDRKKPEVIFFYTWEKKQDRVCFFFPSFSPGWHLPSNKKCVSLCKTEQCLQGKAQKGKRWFARKLGSLYSSKLELADMSVPRGEGHLANFASYDRSDRERSSWPCSLYFLSWNLFCVIALRCFVFFF